MAVSYRKIAQEVRRCVLNMHAASGASHIGSSLSCVDILVALYFHAMKISPQNPCSRKNDKFILSKGHAVSALYAVLAQRGFFGKNLLQKYCCNGSLLAGHPTKGCVPGIEVSCGSLGHGLAMGAGMALSLKSDGLPNRVFVLLSDGECDEGSVWETALFAGHHRLDNLTAIIDYNKFQAFGRTKDVLDLEPFKAKWEAFGWQARESDGHNIEEFNDILKKALLINNKPRVIIAHTIKGKGVSFMEDRLEWHYRSLDPKRLKAALKEVSA